MSEIAIRDMLLLTITLELERVIGLRRLYIRTFQRLLLLVDI